MSEPNPSMVAKGLPWASQVADKEFDICYQAK